MKRVSFFLFGYMFFASAALSAQSTHKERDPLRIATWNVEHLAHPASAGCKPRNEKELIELKQYVSELDADIIALQEVDSISALELLFPADTWQLIISSRADSEPYTCRESQRTSSQQKVAYAVRDGIRVTKTHSVAEIGLDNPGLRHGLSISVASKFGDIRMLNLHLKSGCFVDDYTRAQSEACQIIALQVPVIKQWIDEQAKTGHPFVILGDFNHRLSAPYNRMTRNLKGTDIPKESPITIATAPLIGCHPWYPAPIDHIIVGNLDIEGAHVKAHYFKDMQPENMLSDHCAVSLTL